MSFPALVCGVITSFHAIFIKFWMGISLKNKELIDDCVYSVASIFWMQSFACKSLMTSGGIEVK